MSVIQAKGFCWEVISYFFSGTFPCADPSTGGLGIMRRLRGCLSMLHGAWPTSLENQNISANISHYRKDTGQKLHARSLLFFHALQIVAFRFVFFFACWFFCKRVTFVPEAWEEFTVGACSDVNAVWTIRRANLVLQSLASVTRLLWCSSPWEQGHLLLTGDAPTPHQRSPWEMDTCRVTAD